MQDARTTPPAAKMFRRPAAQEKPATQDGWRQLVYCLFWYQTHAKCPYCHQQAPCAVRVARLTNGWEARDAICRACQVLWPDRVGAKPKLFSPEEVLAEQATQALEPSTGDCFDAMVAKFFPADGPFASRLYREDPDEERRRRSQLLFAWDKPKRPHTRKQPELVD